MIQIKSNHKEALRYPTAPVRGALLTSALVRSERFIGKHGWTSMLDRAGPLLDLVEERSGIDATPRVISGLIPPREKRGGFKSPSQPKILSLRPSRLQNSPNPKRPFPAWGYRRSLPRGGGGMCARLRFAHTHVCVLLFFWVGGEGVR